MGIVTTIITTALMWGAAQADVDEVDPEVTAWLQAAASPERFTSAPRTPLYEDPRGEVLVAELPMGTRVTPCDDGDVSDGERVCVEVAGSAPTWRGFVSPEVLQAQPPAIDVIAALWQEARQRGALHEAEVHVERALALNARDHTARRAFAAQVREVDPAAAEALERPLEGDTRVYVAGPDGQVLFSFIPAREGSLVATVVDEPPFTPGSAAHQRQRADLRHLRRASWFVVDAGAAERATPHRVEVRRAPHRAGFRSLSLVGAPARVMTTAPATRMDADVGGETIVLHLERSGVRVALTPVDGERCAPVSQVVGLGTPLCVGWRGYRVVVQRRDCSSPSAAVGAPDREGDRSAARDERIDGTACTETVEEETLLSAIGGC